MTIHVNIGTAKTRLSELVAAAVRGEDVVLNRAGEPQVRLVPVERCRDIEMAARAARRRSAFGMFEHLTGNRDIDVRTIKNADAEYQQAIWRKHGGPD